MKVAWIRELNVGIDLSFTDFFDICWKLGGFKGPVYALGSLNINQPADTIHGYAAKHGYKNLAADASVRNLLLDRYGITEYMDCDINNKSDIYLDLNMSLDPSLIGKANVVIDGGTIEHIFNIAQSFINVHDLAANGAAIIHTSPLTWYDHAFVNFNPILFKKIADANNYQLMAEAFWFSDAIMDDGCGRDLYITYDGERKKEAIYNKITKLFNGSRIPARALYMIAYRKISDDKFRYPSDVSL